MTARQQRIVEAALDHFDQFGEHIQPAVLYATDQLIFGASPEYHGGERPERDAGEADLLADGLVRALERIDVVLTEPTPNDARTWGDA